MMDIKTRKAFRTGRVIGMAVKTPDHHNLGHIEEVVLDLERGTIAYAVLSFGAYFGFGDKLFAVPWEEFSLVHDEGGKYFIIDTSTERLKQLPGFNRNEWPAAANSDWDVPLAIGVQQRKDEAPLREDAAIQLPDQTEDEREETRLLVASKTTRNASKW